MGSFADNLVSVAGLVTIDTMNVETSGEDAQERRPKSAEASAADILANFQKTFGADEWKMDKQESSEYTGMYFLEVLRGIHAFLVLRVLPFFLIQTYINALSSSPAVKSAFHYDWPPPTLVLLAILTVVALLVHPDGYTWVILRKIRCVEQKVSCAFILDPLLFSLYTAETRYGHSFSPLRRAGLSSLMIMGRYSRQSLH